MTREEKQKAIDALKISAPIMVMTQEEFNDYIRTLNKIMDWLEQEPRKGHWREVDVNMYACSKCSHVLTIDPLDNAISEMNTCPFCSADMRESEVNT